MIKYLIIAILALATNSGFSQAPTPRYDLAICAIYQNEDFFLKEWLEYHRLIGVQHFYLYNNLSTDRHREILAPYIEEGIVEIIDWPVETHNQNEYLELLQIPAYNHALKIVKETSRWAAFIDLDEFLVPLHHQTLIDLLEAYEAYAALAVNWQIFGTSGLYRIPEGKLLIESLIWKAPENYSRNYYVKLIVQPKYVKNIANPHAFSYKAGYFAISTAYVPLEKEQTEQAVTIDKLQINHYWYGTKEWFMNNKLPRRAKWGFQLPEEAIDEIIAPANQVLDTSILRFVNPLKEKITP